MPAAEKMCISRASDDEDVEERYDFAQALRKCGAALEGETRQMTSAALLAKRLAGTTEQFMGAALAKQMVRGLARTSTLSSAVRSQSTA